MTSRFGRLLAAVGVLGVALAAVTWALPALAARLSVGEAAIALLAAAAVFQGLRVAYERRHTSLKIAGTPDPETAQQLSAPGDAFDESLARIGGARPRRTRHRRRTIENRLEEAAVRTIARREGCSRERAREQLAAGTWTDDPHAAALFAGDDGGRFPTLTDAWLFVRGRSRFQFRVTRAVDAIVALSEGDR